MGPCCKRPIFPACAPALFLHLKSGFFKCYPQIIQTHPLVNSPFAVENYHFFINQLFPWPFSVSLFVYVDLGVDLHFSVFMGFVHQKKAIHFFGVQIIPNDLLMKIFGEIIQIHPLQRGFLCEIQDAILTYQIQGILQFEVYGAGSY